MNLRRFAVRTVVIALLHSGLILASGLIAFGRGFNLDQEVEPSRLEQVFGSLLNVLMQPGEMVWTALGITPRSSILEWSMIFLNSLVWGATLALILALFTQTKRSPDAASN